MDSAMENVVVPSAKGVRWVMHSLTLALMDVKHMTHICYVILDISAARTPSSKY